MNLSEINFCPHTNFTSVRYRCGYRLVYGKCSSKAWTSNSWAFSKFNYKPNLYFSSYAWWALFKWLRRRLCPPFLRLRLQLSRGLPYRNSRPESLQMQMYLIVYFTLAIEYITKITICIGANVGHQKTNKSYQSWWPW